MQWAMRYMRHRLLVVYEPERNRYDLSSFFWDITVLFAN